MGDVAGRGWFFGGENSAGRSESSGTGKSGLLRLMRTGDWWAVGRKFGGTPNCER